MTARVFTLPRTPEGRALLRDCLESIRDWRWPDGAPIDDDDFDEQAAELAREPVLTAEEWAEIEALHGRGHSR